MNDKRILASRCSTSRRLLALCVLFCGAGFTHVAPCAAPAEAGPDGQGILVMAHGGSEEWNLQIEKMVEPLRSDYPVEIAFGMARTSTLKQGIERLEAQGVTRIAVVRMFISGESFLAPTEYILGLRENLPSGHHMEPLKALSIEAEILLGRDGVGDSPLIDAILADRILALSETPSEECVLFLAHGPGDNAENERWLATMRDRGNVIGNDLNFSEVHFETLREDWPEKRAEAEARIRRIVQEATEKGERVIVVPFRMAGFGPYKNVLEGLEYVADGKGLCPHPNITAWIEGTAKELWKGIGG